MKWKLFFNGIRQFAKGLAFRAISKITMGIAMLMLLLFLPAGTWNYPNAWIFMGILFIPMLLVGAVLMIKNPALLEKRLNTKEKQDEQKTVVALSAVMFIAGFVLAGLDFRFGWLPIPSIVSYIAAGVFLLAYVMYAEVMRENTYLSRTVEVQENQKVIDTGLYGMVRHPMYTSSILLFLAMPLVLGSLISFIVFLAYSVIIAERIKNEEKVLSAELDGYAEYMQKVKYRLIPFIW